MSALCDQMQTSSPTRSEDLATLVGQAKSGDRSAFALLYDRFHSAVLRRARRCSRDETEAQELCQDVFVIALQKIGQLSDDAAFGAWLMAITVRTAINRGRRPKPVTGVDANVLAEARMAEDDPQRAALSGEARVELRRCLQGMRDLDRQTLKAFYFDGQSVKEMSKRFATNVGTIKRRLFDARKRLEASLNAGR